MWQINITDFNGGYAPNWWKSTYPSYGNKNMAGAMSNCDLTNPNCVTQGPGLATLTAGTEAGAITTLVRGILGQPTGTNLTYAVGGNKLQQFSATAVTNTGDFPHTIDKATVTGEDGEDVALYQGNLYYSYNHSASGGDVGKFNLISAFDDDWGSTTPTGAHALTNNPHQMIVGGNDTLYIANGIYVTEYNGTTFVEQSLDLPTTSVICSLAWAGNRLWIAANRPNLTGANNNHSSIFSWDGNSTSWDDEIVVGGRISALYVRNGVVFVFYTDITSTGGYKLGYINGSAVTDLANFTGAAPEYYQVSEYQEFLIWVSSGLIWAWGSGGRDLPVRLFQLADGGFTTVGGLSIPFGTPVAASNQTTSYKLAKFSGYDVASNWKSLMFCLNSKGVMPIIEGIGINFEGMSTGAAVNVKLLNSKGETLFSDNITYALYGTDTFYYRPLKVASWDFRVELDWAAGSTTNPVKIKNISIFGSN